MKRARLPAKMGVALRAIWRGTVEGFEGLMPRPHVVELARWRKAGWREDNVREYCRRCGATTGPSGSTPAGCRLCIDTYLPWDRLVRVGVYASPLREWILQFKYQRRWLWARAFGPMLARAIRDSDQLVNADPSMENYLTFIPMPFFRRINRIHNQTLTLAETISMETGWPILPILRRRGFRRPQVGLDAKARRRNAATAFGIKALDLRGCRVWLIDDVKTTGSTLKACARLLRKRGAEVNVIVIAVVKSRDEPPPRPMKEVEPAGD